METRQKIDYWLERMATLNATLGIDSTFYERSLVEKEIRICHEKIKELDIEFYNQINPYEEKTDSKKDVF